MPNEAPPPSPPDEKAARAAYRNELRMYRRGWRLTGLALAAAALGLLMWPGMGGPLTLGPLPTRYWGWMLLIASWAILIWIMISRQRALSDRTRDEGR